MQLRDFENKFPKKTYENGCFCRDKWGVYERKTKWQIM